MQQIVVNILISSAEYALIGVGFMLILRVTGFFHIAHGIVFTAGAYSTLAFSEWIGGALVVSASFAVTLCAALGCAMELLVYRPLRHKGASSLILLLASLGIYIVLHNIIAMFFGVHTRTIYPGTVEEGANVLGARITPIQIVILATSLFLLVIVGIVLAKTRLGKAMIAVADDDELARIVGLDSDKVILWALALGSALAGVSGILVALDVNMTPTMGMNALMMGVIAVIIGGFDGVLGVVCGALLLGTAQHLGAWYASSQWQDGIAFAVLLFFLLVRPEGFMGKKVRNATV